MVSASGQLFVGQLCAVAGMALAVSACFQSRDAWQRQQRLQDLSVLVLASAWLVYLVVITALKNGASQETSAPVPWLATQDYVVHLGFQVLMVCVGYFLLLTVGVAQGWAYAMLLGQLVLGLVLLTCRPLALVDTFAQFSTANAYLVWLVSNLVTACLTVGLIVNTAWRARSTAGWLAFTTCVMGLAMCVDQLLVGDKSTRTGVVSQLAFALFLWVVWRITSVQHTTAALSSNLEADFPHSGNLAPLSDFGVPPDTAALTQAMALERRRIGQDLHDGVASQLVSVLSTLDSALPKDQRLVLALEKCLVDLKMTVDMLDASNDNILDGLGCLRYRIQHSLDKLGIRMSWRVEVCDELLAVRGAAALNALRIAQESLSNVMVHAQASAVEVVCRYVPEKKMLLLEVRDNGRGLAKRVDGQGAPTGQAGYAGIPHLGKGLANMRNRAKSVGGELTISSKLGAGTRVRLQLPLMCAPQQPV